MVWQHDKETEEEYMIRRLGGLRYHLKSREIRTDVAYAPLMDLMEALYNAFMLNPLVEENVADDERMQDEEMQDEMEDAMGMT